MRLCAACDRVRTGAQHSKACGNVREDEGEEVEREEDDEARRGRDARLDGEERSEEGVEERGEELGDCAVR